MFNSAVDFVKGKYNRAVTYAGAAISMSGIRKFSKCSESAFGNFHRSIALSELKEEYEAADVTVSSGFINAKLMRSQRECGLSLEVQLLEDHTLRLKIFEEHPSRVRYVLPVGTALATEPQRLRNTVLPTVTSDSVTMQFEDMVVALTLKPFRLVISVNNEEVIRVNSGNLLRFEGCSVGAIRFEPTEATAKDKKVSGSSGYFNSERLGLRSIGMDIAFPGFRHVYGIPEHCDSLALQDTKLRDPYRLFNVDHCSYKAASNVSLYGCVPLIVAHNPKLTVGMFWHNASDTWVDVNHSTEATPTCAGVNTHWVSESGIIDVFFMLGPKPNDIFRQNTRLTGTTPLPPLFALGYHQCRWSYLSEKDVMSVDEGFEKHNIPMDVIWLDIDHTDGFRYFTWHKKNFPNPREMIERLAKKGRKTVIIADPHIKIDDAYPLYKEAKEKKFFVMERDGQKTFEGVCWPKFSAWLDFVNPEVQEFWANKCREHLERFSPSSADLFFWNDMNEPAIFSGAEATIPKDVKHHGGWENRELHNIYGMLQHGSTVRGELLRDNNERTFVLTRSFFAGSQRHGAVWTGDNTADWSHLKASLPMLMSLSISGITFCGADVGGFFGNPSPELQVRWYQAAAYQPFFRGHACEGTIRREPWLLLPKHPEHLEAIKEAIKDRYQLLPFWYTLFREAELTGQPPIKPLWVDFPTDEMTFDMEREHLVGSALLVCPVTSEQAKDVKVDFPGESSEIWFDVDTYATYNGGNQETIDVTLKKIPVFHRGGHIVTRRMATRSSSKWTQDDPFTLFIALDKQGKSRGELYIDDYHSFNYRTGQFTLREFIFQDNRLTNRCLNSDPNSRGEAFKRLSIERIVLIGLKQHSVNLEIIFANNSAEKVKPTESVSYYGNTKALSISFSKQKDASKSDEGSAKGAESDTQSNHDCNLKVDEDWEIIFHNK